MLELRTSDLVPAVGTAGAKLHPVRTAIALSSIQIPSRIRFRLYTGLGPSPAKGRKYTALVNSVAATRRCNPVPNA